MSKLLELNERRALAYRIDPARWGKDVMRVEAADWQAEFLRARRGASIIVLTARQAGKTTTAGWAIAHSMLHYSGSLSVIVCPAQRQSLEPLRRVKEILLKAGANL